MLRTSGLILYAFSLFLAGCSNAGYTMLPAPSADMSVQRPADAEVTAYALRSDDKLAIRFFYNPELNEDVTIGRNGKIALQLVGEIDAAGLYPHELERVIAEKYASILRNPEVNVRVSEYAPRLFYIFGEVNRPGGYPHELGMTIVSAVALAGGLTYRARGDKVRIVRGDDPQATSRTAGPHVAVLPGDVIEVQARFF